MELSAPEMTALGGLITQPRRARSYPWCPEHTALQAEAGDISTVAQRAPKAMVVAAGGIADDRGLPKLIAEAG